MPEYIWGAVLNSMTSLVDNGGIMRGQKLRSVYIDVQQIAPMSYQIEVFTNGWSDGQTEISPGATGA